MAAARRFVILGGGIAEREWMPACHATYKTGIRFAGWSDAPGFESCFHPSPEPDLPLADMAKIDRFIAGCALNFPAHNDLPAQLEEA